MPISVHKKDNETIISLDARFDFACVEEFREAYESAKQGAGSNQFVVDLRNTQHMDSSALGMLINMKKFWNAGAGEIKIINANPQIRKILTISRFDKQFTIE